jgi:hypothetical protein
MSHLIVEQLNHSHQKYLGELNPCAAIYYSSATRPSKLIDGCQGHPHFLPVAWDRPAATKPGSETVYTRNTLFSQHL